jgi:hypothetical protein
VPQLRRSFSLQPAAAVLPALSRPSRTSVGAFVLAVVLTVFSSAFVVVGGVWIRLIFALAVALLLMTMAFTKPALGVITTFVYLVFVALLRRAFLPEAPWVSADPMLLVGPLVAVVLIVKAFVIDRRPWVPDAVSKLVLAILVLTFLEVFNPAGGGIGAGVAGLMFMAVPLLWFFVGREFLRGAEIDRLMALIVVLGTIAACYGLWQTQVGDPPWDAAWLNTPGASGYNSLFVGGTARAFGTFSSFTEYALFVGTALVAAISLVVRGRLIALLPVPVLGVALFLASGRGPLISAAFGIVVMLGLRTRRPLPALVVTVVAVGAAFLALHFGGSVVSNASSGSSALVSHQISGITNPLDPNSSTLLVHVQEVIAGFKSSISHPFGQGTAVTNDASGLAKTNGATNTQPGATPAVGPGSQTTEVDISNAFVGLGIPGGVLYVMLVLLVLVQSVRSYFRGHVELLPIIGILVAGLGEWENGGFYALAPLIWMLIGVVAATSGSIARQRKSGFAAQAVTDT